MRAWLGALLIVTIAACGDRTTDDNKAMCRVFVNMGKDGPTPKPETARKAYSDLEELLPSNERLAAIRATVLRNRDEVGVEGQFALEVDQVPQLREICRGLDVAVPDADDSALLARTTPGCELRGIGTYAWRQWLMPKDFVRSLSERRPA